MASVSDTVTRISVPEAARRLGIPGDDVYRLIFRGLLLGRPSSDGAVYVATASIDEYQATPASGQATEP